jgi:curved DNA-binding protein
MCGNLRRNRSGQSVITQVRLKGKGFPVYKKAGQHGDLYVTYEIMLPTKLSKPEKALFTTLSTLR